MKASIKYIKENFPIGLLLKKLNILPPNHNLNYRFPCPIHFGTNPNCIITNNNQIHCFKCNSTFDIISIYMKIRNITDFKKTVAIILKFMDSQEYKNLLSQQQIDQTVNAFKSNKTYQSKAIKEPITETQLNEVKIIFNLIRDFYHEILINNHNKESQVALNYLLNQRKLTIQTIKELKIGFAPLSGNVLSFRLVNYLKNKNIDFSKAIEFGIIKEKLSKKNKTYQYDSFHGSIIIPIENENKDTFHFYQNLFLPSKHFQPKYKSINNVFQINIFNYSYLFFKALPHILQTKTMILHEGFYDAISCHQNGIKNVVCPIIVAQSISRDQIAFIKKENIKVIIAFDNDETGRKRNEEIANQLRKENIDIEIRRIWPPYNKTCKDVDDLLKQYGFEIYQKCFLDKYVPYQEVLISNFMEILKRDYPLISITIIE